MRVNQIWGPPSCTSSSRWHKVNRMSISNSIVHDIASRPALIMDLHSSLLSSLLEGVGIWEPTGDTAMQSSK